MKFRKATIEDMGVLSAFINAENGSSIGSEHLIKWYCDNPFNSSSIILCELDGEFHGLSSTNNFMMNIEGEMKLVAFPQKVLTSEKIRGKGVFKELYRLNERDDIDNENVDCFLTFTNEMSTQIFLNKFGYVRGGCPLIAVLPSLPYYSITRDVTVKVVDKFNENYLREIELSFDLNSILKDAKFIAWRYTHVLDPKGVGYHILEIKKRDEIVGYSVVKRHSLMYTPWFYLMDVICSSSEHVAKIIAATRDHVRSKWALGMVAIVNDQNRPYFEQTKFKMVFNNKLNFLVKGSDSNETHDLSQVQFNFSFGDLDFI